MQRKPNLISKRNNMKIIISTVFLVLISNVIFAEQGTYETVFSGSSSMETIDMPGGKATSGSLYGVDTVTKTSGAPFLMGESTTGDCVLYLEKIEAGTNLSGRCAMTHPASGDRLYFTNSRKVGDTNTGSGGGGTSTIVGGTGRYAGMAGSCQYVVQYLPGKKFAAIQKCSWNR